MRVSFNPHPVCGVDKHFLYGNDVSGVNKKGLGYSALQDRILEVKNEN